MNFSKQSNKKVSKEECQLCKISEKSWKEQEPAVTLPQGVIGPVCAAKVAPRLPLGKPKKTAQNAWKPHRRGVSDEHTEDLFDCAGH